MAFNRVFVLQSGRREPPILEIFASQRRHSDEQASPAIQYVWHRRSNERHSDSSDPPSLCTAAVFTFNVIHLRRVNNMDCHHSKNVLESILRRGGGWWQWGAWQDKEGWMVASKVKSILFQGIVERVLINDQRLSSCLLLTDWLEEWRKARIYRNEKVTHCFLIHAHPEQSRRS